MADKLKTSTDSNKNRLPRRSYTKEEKEILESIYQELKASGKKMPTEEKVQELMQMFSTGITPITERQIKSWFSRRGSKDKNNSENQSEKSSEMKIKMSSNGYNNKKVKIYKIKMTDLTNNLASGQSIDLTNLTGKKRKKLEETNQASGTTPLMVIQEPNSSNPFHMQEQAANYYSNPYENVHKENEINLIENKLDNQMEDTAKENDFLAETSDDNSELPSDSDNEGNDLKSMEVVKAENNIFINDDSGGDDESPSKDAKSVFHKILQKLQNYLLKDHEFDRLKLNFIIQIYKLDRNEFNTLFDMRKPSSLKKPIQIFLSQAKLNELMNDHEAPLVFLSSDKSTTVKFISVLIHFTPSKEEFRSYWTLCA